MPGGEEDSCEGWWYQGGGECIEENDQDEEKGKGMLKG